MSLAKYNNTRIGKISLLIKATLNLIPDARNAIQKPATIPFILKSAYRAHIMLVFLLIFLIFLAPIIADFITTTAFPPDSSTKLFGLIENQHTNPLKGPADVFILAVLWIISIASSLLYLWFHIPVGLARANVRARKLLDLSDNDLGQKGNQKRLEKALSLATDTELESQLLSRLQNETLIDNPPVSIIKQEIGTAFNPNSNKRESLSKELGPQGRYSLGTQLGKGAMGVVYRAWDNVLDRKIAIKQLPLALSADNEYALRFRREAKALARLTHPNIVQVYDFIEDGLHLWMTLEFVEGGDLASYLKGNNSLTVQENIGIIILIAEGLAYAHDQGIIHRDLKPANILLTKEHEPKITDFGIAKVSQASHMTEAGTVLGSPRYMSPEQCSGGHVDSRTDIYALGISLYELLSGKAPFEGDTSSVMARQIVEQPKPLSEIVSGIPLEIEILNSRMLAKNPDDRPSNMKEVIDLLLICRNTMISKESPQLHR